nr:tyrosine-type recombinase/integrase [Sulfitobacter maritimus]
MYLEERRHGNPYGYDPLATTTAQNVRSSIKHLLDFLGEGATLHDVTTDKADQFRMEYLPVRASVKPQTVAKHTTLLRGMWTWAITDKKLLRGKGGRPIQNPWTVEERGIPRRKAKLRDSDKRRTLYSAAEVSKLLAGFPSRGSRQGDLMRLLLATGCRVDEIGSLRLQYVDDDGAGFVIPKGKTAKARRRIPLVDMAQRLMAERVALANQLQLEVPAEERRLFPEWPLKPSTQKINSASQWFTRYRREALGKDTDGSLSLHSFRHTWRTMARRAGVPEDHIRELGGWEDSKDVSKVYDHGLTEQQLRDAQAAIWETYRQAGYLQAY